MPALRSIVVWPTMMAGLGADAAAFAAVPVLPRESGLALLPLAAGAAVRSTTQFARTTHRCERYEDSVPSVRRRTV